MCRNYCLLLYISEVQSKAFQLERYLLNTAVMYEKNDVV